MNAILTFFAEILVKIMGWDMGIEYNDNEDAVILPPDRIRQFSFGAPMFVLNQEYLDTVETGSDSDMWRE